MNLTENFRDSLLEILCETNMTHRMLEKEIGVSNGSISKWKNGKELPTLENLIKLSVKTGRSMDYLLGRSDQPTCFRGFTATLAERLTELCRTNGYTPYRLSRELSVKPDRVYSWIHGTSLPNLFHLCAIADIFGCSLDYLAGRT